MQDISTDMVADVLLSVVRTLSTGGYSCLVEILKDGQPAHRLNRPRPEDEAASWAQMSMLLEDGPGLVLTGTWVGVRFEGRTRDGAYVGALVARSHTGTVNPGDGARIQRMVDYAVFSCAEPPTRSDVVLREAAAVGAGVG